MNVGSARVRSSNLCGKLYARFSEEIFSVNYSLSWRSARILLVGEFSKLFSFSLFIVSAFHERIMSSRVVLLNYTSAHQASSLTVSRGSVCLKRTQERSIDEWRRRRRIPAPAVVTSRILTASAHAGLTINVCRLARSLPTLHSVNTKGSTA